MEKDRGHQVWMSKRQNAWRQVFQGAPFPVLDVLIFDATAAVPRNFRWVLSFLQ
jgi:hypothetical protein